MADPLDRYWQKRDFNTTSEPKGEPAPGKGAKAKSKLAAEPAPLSFVIQKHAASHLHYDFRLELDGTLKSWAVPKGPSLDPADKRMAVHVEDHPISYGSFEGTIPPKQYGAGTVIVWDRGTWVPLGDAEQGYESGKLKFELRGEKLHGHWTLVRMRGRGESHEPWLLIKERDDEARPSAEYSVTEALPGSVIDPSSQLAADMVAAAKSSAKGKAVGKTAAKPTAKAPLLEASAPPAASAPASQGKPKPRAAAAKPSASGAPAMPDGAVPADLPLTLSPQLATLVDQVPPGSDWVYEIKFDGYRIVTRIDDGTVRLYTRNGHDWSAKLPGLAKAIAEIGLADAWLDGEIIVQGDEGTPNFQLLQNAFDSARTNDIQYFVFDMPYYGGYDMRAVPLSERRAFLRAQLQRAPAGSRIHFSEDFQASAGDMLHTACQLRLEGVIGKRKDSTYSSRRSPAWIKLKCTQRQEFVIGGYTDPKGSRKGLGALLLGVHDQTGKLRYAGNVGTGFDDKTLADVTAKLQALETERPAFADKPREVKGHWVKPTLMAEVSFSEWTQDGRVRHAVFHGLRTDKPPTNITREVAAHVSAKGAEPTAEVAAAQAPAAAKTQPAPAGKPPRAGKRAAAPAAEPSTEPAPRAPAKTARTAKAAKPGDAMVDGVKITHPDRIVDEQSGVTKLELAEYYERVAKAMLPHLAARPVSLVRGPDGVGGQLFFQKHADPRTMPAIKQLDKSIDPEHGALLEIDSVAGLLGAVQMNVIEFHTWNSTTASIDQPDRMTFDLDPGDGVAWSVMQEAAQLTQALLKELGLVAFLKTSGGKGLHVVVPFALRLGWDDVKSLSEAVVLHLAKTLPDRFVAKSGPKNRVGKIFVDYLRNGRGATTAAAFTARARPGMGVSIPVAWDELPSLTSGAHWTARTADERLKLKTDPWAGYDKGAGQTLDKAIKLLKFKLSS